jgi:hypothetical protein
VTLAERLLEGEHHGCTSWQDVAKRLGVNERTLRKTRQLLKAQGRELSLGGGSSERKPLSGPDIAHAAAHGSEPTVNNRVKWPSVAAFDAGHWQPSDFRNPEQLPYVPAVTPMTRKLTRAECPDGTMILWASDIHIPIHNVIGGELMIECAERNGVTRTIMGGDILDFNCLSRHKKQARRVVEHATLLEEVEPGRAMLNWFASKQSDYILGNHEGRLQSFIDENPIFHGSVASNFAQVVDLPRSINVVPQGGEVRLGSLSARHLDAEFKGGSGGKYPAQQVLDKLPYQCTMGGHVHRISVARRTTRDEDGISRTHCAWTMGHMSVEHEHYDYVSTSPNWQTGFAMIRVYWEGDRPRYSVYQIEVLFDRHNRPYFEFGGHVYSAARKVAA